ncbi:flagellin [Campylobacter jejuni]|uniref:flagellin n=1 Tax=Campylobacter jejuni TaxID=197 RepID=UPI000575FA4F|nr:flagellin [Campylobacter jejuni]
MGFFASIFDTSLSDGSGELNLKKAMALMDVSDNAISDLSAIRSDIGSVQNQLQATINNISITEISLLNSASNIKDLDFANENLNYIKSSIISQSNTAMLYKANTLKTQLFTMLFKF